MGGLDWLRAWVFSLIFLGWTLCETRKATKAEYQPYIVSLHDQFDVYHYIPDNRNTVINFVGDFVIKNIGRTPASNIQVTATIKYKARNYGERKDFHEKGVIDSFMKRCVLAIFALNLLCAPISYAQDNPAPSQKTTKSSPAQNSKTPAPAAKTEPQNNESKKDLKPIIPADNPSIDERMAKIAQEANDFSEIQTYINGFGLFLLFLTTVYARRAWLAGAEGVNVTRKATKAEYQPYIISLHDSFDVSHYIPGHNNTVINFVGDFDIKNIGRTPASNIQVSADIKYQGKNYGENRAFDVQGTITNWRFDDLHPDEWRTFKLNFELVFPNGDAQKFMKIREMDIWIRVMFNDLFGQTRCQVLHFLIDDMAAGAHLQGSKEEKQYEK